MYMYVLHVFQVFSKTCISQKEIISEELQEKVHCTCICTVYVHVHILYIYMYMYIIITKPSCEVTVVHVEQTHVL